MALEPITRAEEREALFGLVEGLIDIHCAFFTDGDLDLEKAEALVQEFSSLNDAGMLSVATWISDVIGIPRGEDTILWLEYAGIIKREPNGRYSVVRPLRFPLRALDPRSETLN
jgi:hypothetical protein